MGQNKAVFQEKRASSLSHPIAFAGAWSRGLRNGPRRVVINEGGDMMQLRSLAVADSGSQQNRQLRLLLRSESAFSLLGRNESLLEA